MPGDLHWLAARLMSHQELELMLVDLQLEARLLALSAFLESHLQRQPSSTVWNAL